MALGLVISSLLLLNHHVPDQYHCVPHRRAFGARFLQITNNPTRSTGITLGSSVVDASVEDAVHNTTDERIDYGFDEIRHFSEQASVLHMQNNDSFEFAKLERSMQASTQTTKASEEVRKDQYQEQDDRHDDILDDIEHHINAKDGATDRRVGGTGAKKKDRNNYNNYSCNRRGNVQLPPGWGKTQLALNLISRLYKNGIMNNGMPLGSVLYVVPCLVLVDQLFDHINRFGELKDIPHSCLIVASKSNTTEALTTSPDKIAEFLNPKEKSDELRLLVCTYNSLPRIGEALLMLNQGKNDSSLDLAIFDEAHVMEGVGNVTGYGLHDENLPTSYRLFLTATPYNYTSSPEERFVLGSRLGQDGSNKLISRSGGKSNRIVRSFDDTSLFGPCIARRSLCESEEQNITVPLTLVAIDKAEINSLLGDSFDVGSSHDELLPFFLRAAFEKLKVRRALTFHSINERARAFSKGARRLFGTKVASVTVNGTMSASKREAMLSEAKKASQSVVSNCRLLATGVDEAEWDLVFMADPVTSPVLTRQMVGRVSRMAPGKTRGYVLVPVFVTAYDVESVLASNSSGYHWFLSAFEAMVADDPILKRDVVFISEESERIGRPLLSSEYPESVRNAFILPPSMPIDISNHLMERVIIEVSTGSTWDKWYELLLQYKEREGHCNVPRAHREDGFNLGLWLARQRQFCKRGSLVSDRKQRLDEAGVSWDRHADKWDNMFALLLQYKEREGHCNIPKKHEEDGVYLGNWLHSQRASQKKGTMDSVMKQRLDEIGVSWDRYADEWDNMFALLSQYKEREGHCNVKLGHKENCSNLGQWVAFQRKMRKRGRLDPTRERRLGQVGFVWDLPKHQWEKKFSLLLQFKDREDHCNVPRGHKEDGVALGVWLKQQRQQRRRGRLDDAKEQRLGEVGVVWDFHK